MYKFNILSEVEPQNNIPDIKFVIKKDTTWDQFIITNLFFLTYS